MTITEAAKLLRRKFPERTPIGYWLERNGDIVFNTKGEENAEGDGILCTPAQYVVTRDGAVYGTNPMRHDISLKTMQKF